MYGISFPIHTYTHEPVLGFVKEVHQVSARAKATTAQARALWLVETVMGKAIDPADLGSRLGNATVPKTVAPRGASHRDAIVQCVTERIEPTAEAEPGECRWCLTRTRSSD